MPNKLSAEREKEKQIIKRHILPLWKLYIGEFFHNDKRLYSKRNEPYIFYKHLFRQFVNTRITTKERIRDFEEKVTGTRPHHDTIYQSLEKDPNHFKLTQKELTEALTFLNKYYNMNLNQHLKTKVMEAKNKGYLTEDIARHCRVHEEVIEDILNNKEIDYHILKQMESELS